MLCVPHALVNAQSGPPADAGNETTIILATNKGAAVDLTASDVEVKEDGKAATVRSVRKLGRGPLQYCILFDTSGSERQQFHLQQTEAQAFLSEAVKPGVDHGRLYLFNDEPQETEDTTNPRELAASVASSEARHGTALYDAIEMCARRMLRNVSGPPLRAIFVFSDGKDNASHIPLTVAIEWALKAEIRIYSFDPAPGGNDRGKIALKDLSRSTGGNAYSVPGESQMTSVLSGLKDALENQFAISYTPAISGRTGLRDFAIKCRKKGVSIIAPDKSYKPAN